ncbi:WD40 repeat-like protein [Dichomitus squalens]|uniref:WD40 repeat-like protein n=1 Tax=Dichomitus squalens TaxID=114155 RepID=A0A4Q9M9Q9_9APHY|nr:WD40 repeat-like protein [Dichomitus squalens]
MRHGYPLWHPEIERGKGLVMRIGDVGYLKGGAFFRIFNATLPSDHQDHSAYGTPDNHEPFRIKPILIHTHDVIESHLCSRSVLSYDYEGSITTVATPVGAGMKFHCSQEQGAFVFMNVAAEKTMMHATTKLAPFMRNNIDKWHDFVTGTHSLDISKEEIVFVSGVVKTEDWGLGAFMNQAKGGAVAFSAQVPFCQGAFSVQVEKGRAMNVQMRTKPKPSNASFVSRPNSLLESAGGSTASAASSSQGYSGVVPGECKKNQTLFFHYYKIKNRLWFRKGVFQAAAGPDERDPDHTGDGEDVALLSQHNEEWDVVEEPPIDESYDPVDYLLDYILAYPMEDGSEVPIAIASDLHIYALFEGEVPLDIKGALKELLPPVMFVDDDRQVACVAVAEWAEDIPDSDIVSSKAAGKQKSDLPAPDDPGSQERPPAEGDDPKPEGEDKDAQPSNSEDPQANPPVTLHEHTGGVTCVSFSPDGRYIASGSEDTTVILRDGTTGALIQRLTDNNEPVWALAFSPDSTRLCTGANNGMALIWDVEARSVVTVLDGHTGLVQTIAYSPDGQKIVTSSVDFSARVWDATTGTLIHKYEDHGAVVMSAIFSPDGLWVATCGADYSAKIWHAENGTLHHSLDAHKGVVWSIGFSPDSRRLITGSDDMTSRIWRVTDGEELVILHEHQGPVWAVRFSSNGKYILSASNDATIKVCDSFTGERKHVFNRHDTLVNAAVFSPDGKWIASSASNNVVMVWNTETGKNLPVMEGHLDKVTGLQFSPDGERLVSCSDDGSVRIWTLPDNADGILELVPAPETVQQ